MTTTTLNPTQIRTDGGTQPRERISTTTVEKYTEDMKNGDTFPPIDVYYDGRKYWLGDGYHRLTAHTIAFGKKPILVTVHQGTQRDAILHSVGANATHGLPRNHDDKRRAVHRLLTDNEWTTWSDREIARRTKTSPTFVGKIRADLLDTGHLPTVHVDSSARTYTKQGRQETMNTTNIGRQPDPITTRAQNLQNATPQTPINLTHLSAKVQQYIDSYVDHLGRTFSDLDNPAHTNSVFWQDITNYFDQAGLPYNEPTLKHAINHLQYTTPSPQKTTEPVDTQNPANDLHTRLKQSLHNMTGAAERWQRRREVGQTNEQLKQAIAYEFGIRGGGGGPGLPHVDYKGGVSPEFRYDTLSGNNPQTISGTALRDLVRDLLEIPYPTDSAFPPTTANYASINELESRIRDWLHIRTGGRTPAVHLDIMNAIKQGGKRSTEFKTITEWLTTSRTNFRSNDLWQACQNTHDQLTQQLTQKTTPPQPPTEEDTHGDTAPTPPQLNPLDAATIAQKIHEPRIEQIRWLRAHIQKLITFADKETETQLITTLNRAALALDAALAILRNN